MNKLELCLDVQDISLSFKTRKGFFRYNKFDALDSINFQLFKGETLGVIGGNGSGKSTLLKVLAGILQSDKGKIISHVDYISLLSLATGFDQQLSGRNNAILSAMLLGHSKTEAINALPEILAFSELGDAFDQPVKSYSSGMKARLGFSVAILMDTDVLLVDETLGVGDAGFRVKAERAILDRLSSLQTVVFVSHSAAQIKRLCSRVVWLDKGKVKKVGDAAPIVNEYEKFIKDKRSLSN